MSFSAQLLDAAKAAQGIASDYALAARLGVTRAAVSNYRHGRKFPDLATTYALAEMAGTSPIESVMMVNLERAAGGRDAEVWAKLRAELREASAAHR